MVEVFKAYQIESAAIMTAQYFQALDGEVQLE